MRCEDDLTINNPSLSSGQEEQHPQLLGAVPRDPGMANTMAPITWAGRTPDKFKNGLTHADRDTANDAFKKPKFMSEKKPRKFVTEEYFCVEGLINVLSAAWNSAQRCVGGRGPKTEKWLGIKLQDVPKKNGAKISMHIFVYKFLCLGSCTIFYMSL